MHVTGEANPMLMQFNDIKIGDDIPIEMSAFHWVEAMTEMHAMFRINNEQMPVVLQVLMGKVFAALTPEDYRKALHAEHAEVEERAMQQHPLAMMQRMFGGDNGMQIPDPEQFRDGDDG